jgi:dihydropteroate synthase
MNLKIMGVINITPNSFSDGGEFFSSESISTRLSFLNKFDAIDIGAESTAPMNASILWTEEWERWQMVLPLLRSLTATISIDSYHPETVFELVRYFKDHKMPQKLIWNDVSGKFDESVREFLKTGYDYIFCHNLAPSRALSGRHMDYLSEELDLLSYFSPFKLPQVIFDPCIGFSKTYEQNVEILASFGDLQKKLNHNRWLLGFSRKSILKTKYQTTDRDKLDQLHIQEIEAILPTCDEETWVRTHRPELIRNH